MRFVPDQRAISDLDPGNVGDGIERPRRQSSDGNAKIAQPRTRHGALLSPRNLLPKLSILPRDLLAAPRSRWTSVEAATLGATACRAPNRRLSPSGVLRLCQVSRTEDRGSRRLAFAASKDCGRSGLPNSPASGDPCATLSSKGNPSPMGVSRRYCPVLLRVERLQRNAYIEATPPARLASGRLTSPLPK